MRIEWTPPVPRSAARRDEKADSAGEEKFSSALHEEAPSAAASAPPKLNPLSTLLSIQELPDALTGRRRALQRGNSLLDRLEDLRLGLIAGIVPRERLQQLAELARSARDSVDDPRLAELLDHIDLRVAVELAKLAQSP
jgi:hypothetical protein